MGKKAVSYETKCQIIGLSKDKTNTNTKIANLLGVSEKCVRTTLRNFERSGSVKDSPRSGRPQVTTERQKRRISLLFDKKGKLPLRRGTVQVETMIGKPISPSTVRRILSRTKLDSYFAVKKPYLTITDKKKRLKWCKERQSWSAERWRHVIFSDESNFEVINRKNRFRVWRKKSDKYRPDKLQYKTQGGGGSVGIWGCMTAQGTVVNMIYDGRLNQYRYKDILDECLKPSVDLFFAGQYSTQPNSDWYFQNDNAPCHTAGSIKEYMFAEKIMMLPWPARCPDLNPIENLWSWVDHQLQIFELRSIDQLKDAIHSIWIRITPEMCDRLINSMPKRIEACIKAKGGHIKY